MPTSRNEPRPLRVGARADESWLWRDARQIALVDRFFRGERPAGPVGLCSWRWPSLVGRDAAFAFLHACHATSADAEARRNVAALLRVWPGTLFHQAPEQFRLVETMEGELPFPLPRDADGYNHHGVEWRGRRYFVTAYPQGDRVIMSPSGAMWIIVIEQRAGGGARKPIRGFIERDAERPRRPGILDEVRTLHAERGPVPCERKRASALAARLRVPRETAEELLSGALLLARVSDREAGVDWERVVDVIDSAFAADPSAWWHKSASAVVLDALADRWKKTAALERRIADVRALKLGGLSKKRARGLKLPATGALSPHARRFLAAELGMTGRAAHRAADLAAEVQQLRFDGGIDAFGKLLAKLARELGDDAPRAFDFIYQHVEHSH